MRFKVTIKEVTEWSALVNAATPEEAKTKITEEFEEFDVLNPDGMVQEDTYSMEMEDWEVEEVSSS